MELSERIDLLLDRLPGAESALGLVGDRVSQGGAWLLTVELPVPDLALLGAFVLAAGATILSQRGRSRVKRRSVEDLFRAELLAANRRAQQAHGELSRARMAIEHERQKRRREAAAATSRPRRVAAVAPASPPDRPSPVDA
jgi:hypothetical protein